MDAVRKGAWLTIGVSLAAVVFSGSVGLAEGIAWWAWALNGFTVVTAAILAFVLRTDRWMR